MYISPTHFSSLLQKIGLDNSQQNKYKCDSGRIEQISEFLANRTELKDDEFEILWKSSEDKSKFESTSKIMSDLKSEIEGSNTKSVTHKLVQISGK